MRSAIYAELKNLYPVYYIGNTEKTTKKPYVILHFGTPIKTRLGSWNVFSVTAYAPLGDFEMLDFMCEKIIKSIDHKHIKRKLGDGSFLVQYENCSSDDVEGTLGAISKQLNFRIPIFGGDFM